MRKVWIVVSNSSDAKILKAENVNHLVEIRNMEHLESRLSNRELSSDKPGKATMTSSSGVAFGFGPHTIEDKLSPKNREKGYFADEIAAALLEGYKENAYERLYIIAPPHFIALIKEHLDPKINKLIHQEIHKDVVTLTPKEIREYLPPVL